MSRVIHLVPLVVAILPWFALHRLNRSKRWFRIGELIFWDAIILVIAYLIWLHWF